jgi:hypothetical protein
MPTDTYPEWVKHLADGVQLPIEFTSEAANQLSHHFTVRRAYQEYVAARQKLDAAIAAAQAEGVTK